MSGVDGTLKRTPGGTLGLGQVGESVLLQGWAQRNRDLGGLVFIDLRDRSGIMQCVFNPEQEPEAHALARQVRNEYVVEIRGVVSRRPEGTRNPSIPTGEIEVRATSIRILNASKPIPFDLTDGEDVSEQVRLQFRYLDLRRTEMQQRMALRHRFNKSVRDFLDAEGFWEVETPILMKSTPEGARDFLVPSRMSPGDFYALPQSPQLLKQILMVSGVEKYFQIARCFRDEDLRADRQPEFTQVDAEMSFVDQDDIIDVMERLMARVFADCTGHEVTLPVPRLTYSEAMNRYGVDRPDTRYGLELVDLNDLAATSGFRVFSSTVASGGTVKGMRVPGAGVFSRKQVDDLEALAKTFGASGLVWIARTAGGVKSAVSKFFSQEEMSAILDRLEVQEGDLALIVAGSWHKTCSVLGRLRQHLAEGLGLIAEGQWSFLWVVDFPAFEYDEEARRFTFTHNPVSAPRPSHLHLVDEGLRLLQQGRNATILPDSPDHPLARILSQQYDMVLNGSEIGGGSIRIHNAETQLKVFEILGFSREKALDRFGFLLNALEFGAPPHGGIAFGVDRVVALMSGATSIREVIAFPKTANGSDLMMQAPSPVSLEQLQELRLKLIVKQEPK